jgi:hypothetical protein
VALRRHSRLVQCQRAGTSREKAGRTVATASVVPTRPAEGPAGPAVAMYSTLLAECQSYQVQVQVCFTSVCGQVQPLDVALSNSAKIVQQPLKARYDPYDALAQLLSRIVRPVRPQWPSRPSINGRVPVSMAVQFANRHVIVMSVSGNLCRWLVVARPHSSPHHTGISASDQGEHKRCPPRD